MDDLPAGTPIAVAPCMSKPTKSSELEGEGSYTATRRYNEHLEQHQKSHDTDELAEQARRALEGDEGEELAQAERRGRGGPAGPVAPTPGKTSR